MSTPLTITLGAIDACGKGCQNCPSGSACKRLDRATFLDFDATVKWLAKFAPNASIHVSGGEPLLRTDLDACIKKLLDADHNVSLFTSESNLRSRPELLGLPITWHVTHHEHHMLIDTFIDGIEPIKNKPHLIARLIQGEAKDETRRVELEKRYRDAGFYFRWIKVNNGYHNYTAPDSELTPAQQLLLIDSAGNVCPCSTVKNGAIGNIHKMTFDTDAADAHRCRARIPFGKCQPWQTAVLLEQVRENFNA